MTEQFVTVAQLRTPTRNRTDARQVEIAFVVIPVATEEGFAKLCFHQAQKLDHLAQISEQAGGA